MVMGTIRKTVSLTFLLVISLHSFLIAASPHAVIHGPTSGRPGDLIELDGTKSDGDNFQWNIKRFDNGPIWNRMNFDQRKVQISTYPGIYYVQLIVSGEDGIDTCECYVTISGQVNPTPPTPNPPGPAPPNPSPPGPGPQPTPNPPEPSIPEGEFGIAPKIVKWSKLVASENRSTQAQQLAEGLKTVQSQVAAGTLTNPRKILTAMLKVNRSTLGDQLSFWKKFGEMFATEIARLYREGKLNNSKAWALLLLEIIIGLQSIK
jgi:hypothetical protein